MGAIFCIILPQGLRLMKQHYLNQFLQVNGNTATIAKERHAGQTGQQFKVPNSQGPNQIVRIAIKKCLNNRNLSSHSSSGWKSEIKVSAELAYYETFSSACRQPSSPYLSTWFPLCMCLCLNLLFFWGPQSYWIRVSHKGLILA